MGNGCLPLLRPARIKKAPSSDRAGENERGVLVGRKRSAPEWGPMRLQQQGADVPQQFAQALGEARGGGA
ncbi:hypothetical protein, partial [Pseudomonas citronellolis]|uniref:hypothetical protein n=1 Tax=Pseudomonas citronellolis TaxID=53408 RepID=UPI00248DBCD9